jgi:hypothetical protein
MDPLSDVLTLLNPRSAMSARLVTGGAWAMEFPAYDGVKFTVIANGACFLAVDSMEQTIPLKAGRLLSADRRQSVPAGERLEPACHRRPRGL